LRTAYQTCFLPTSETKSIVTTAEIFIQYYVVLLGEGGLRLDYTIHINNGAAEPKPIVLRLFAGEETSFNLHLVNHGEPSNISLETSDPLIKAVLLKRPEHYVVAEETIPVLARMPEKVRRLDGEILVTSNLGNMAIPISLVREAEDPGDDQEELPSQIPDQDLSEIEDGEGEEGEGEAREEEGEGDDEGDRETAAEREPEEEVVEGERIRFSRHRDLASYKAASRPQSVQDEREAKGSQAEPAGDLALQGAGPQGNEYSPPEAEPEESEESSERANALLGLDRRRAVQLVPAAAILLMIISLLVLTFYTESIPEFLGALASSILIVTLIIYGAATLLKA
jgi:hypothetical protein